MQVARTRVLETLARIPHVTFRKTPTAKLSHVSFDNRPVPLEYLEKKFSVDPGDHVVEVVTELPSGKLQMDRCTLHVAERTMNRVSLR